MPKHHAKAHYETDSEPAPVHSEPAPQTNITTREWFAGMALSLIGNYPATSSTYHDPQAAAQMAFEIADAMIAQGSKPPTE
jgi:hypothetical protein